MNRDDVISVISVLQGLHGQPANFEGEQTMKMKSFQKGSLYTVNVNVSKMSPTAYTMRVDRHSNKVPAVLLKS